MKNKLCGSFLLAVAVLHCVLGDYELEVRLHEYNNPTSRCGCGSDMVNGTELMRCCDHNGITETCMDGDKCDNYFISCFREIRSDGPCITDQLALTSPSFDNTSSVDFTTIGSINSDVTSDDNASSAVNGTNIKFNASSSILLLQRTGAWEGVQLFINSMDSDDGTTFILQLVDSFTIDLDTSFLIPGAGFTARTVYNGTFDFAYLELSFRVSCAENFFGSNCTTECIPPSACDENGTLVCLPGFTGANCMTNIDDCSNNNACGPNEQCVDGIGTFNCQCSPGFTGERCETDIDDCANANCSESSRCVDEVNSFTCECSAGFTGTFCENHLPPEADSQGNTNAIIGGAVGAAIGAIALVLILALVLVIVTRKRKSRLKISGSSKDVPPRDNPTYETSCNPIKPETHNSSVATATTSIAPPNGTSVDDPERVFDNPIYGAPGFDTGDPEDRLYTQPVKTVRLS